MSSALILRLGGYGSEWLPSAGRLLGLLLLSHVAGILWRHRARHAWREAVRSHAFEVGLAVIACAAVAVRLTGFGLDLGHQPLDIDEHRLSSNVKHFFVTGELRHDTVEHYPGLVFWLFSGASFLSYLRELTRGFPHEPADVSLDLFVHSARMANVCVGAGIAVLTGLIGRHVSGGGAALVAALILAIVPHSVELTLVRNDLGMVATALLATLAALANMNDRRKPWALGAGALAGMSAAIKYSGLFAIVPVLLATWSPGPLRERLERAGLAVAGFIVAVAITNHFIWYDFPNFLRQLYDQIAITGRGHWAASDNPAAFYTMILDRFAVGWPMLLFAALFAVSGLASRDRRLWIFLSLPVLYIAFMIQRPSQFPRWVFPVLPFVAIAGSAALAAVIRFIRRGAVPETTGGRYAKLAVSAAVATAILWHPVWSGVVAYSRRVTPPTHIAAEIWILKNVPAGDVILLGNEWLSLPSSHTVKRVPDLQAVLDGGMKALAGFDWVVVPELYFGHPTLRQLRFAQRFDASQTFGGRVGFDFQVYAVPAPPDRR